MGERKEEASGNGSFFQERERSVSSALVAGHEEISPSQSVRKSKQEATELQNSNFTDALLKGTLLSKFELVSQLNLFKPDAYDLSNLAAGRKLAAQACGKKSGHLLDDQGGNGSVVGTNEHGRTLKAVLTAH